MKESRVLPDVKLVQITTKKMLVTKFIEIDMGHRVPNHKSKCRNLHGHRYLIEVGVDDRVIDTEGASDEGMVMDFGDLKKAMISVIDDNYDHGFVMDEKDPLWAVFGDWADDGMKIIFVPFVPTAEKLAEHWYWLMRKELEPKSIKLKFVRVWETPTSTATYEEPTISKT